MNPFKLTSGIVHRACLSLLVVLMLSCTGKPRLVAVDPAFSKYIEAYTSGVISKKSTIRIKLAAETATTHTLNETINEKLFSFKPAVNGKAYWIDSRTVEFNPAQDLTPGQLYEVDFALEKLLKVPANFKKFVFNVQVIKPAFQLNEFGLKAANNSKDMMLLTGEIISADVEESTNIEKLLTATLNGSAQTIQWQHNPGNKQSTFTINNIKRTNSEQQLKLSANGKAINSTFQDAKTLAVPAIGDFKVLSIRAIQNEEEYVLTQFSDPVAINQDLNGLIVVSDMSDLSYTINGSEVKTYTGTRMEGNYTVHVNTGIENQFGAKLSRAGTGNVFFENRLPSVVIHGRGNILPNSGGRLLLPFEAVNLKAVDVSIIKIYQNNIVQFLQSNTLAGENELRRVAKPLATATIKLDEDKSVNLQQRTRFSLDIDKYIRTEPGAIYRVVIGFRPEYSLYTCTKVDTTANTEEDDEPYYNEYADEGSDNSLDDDDAFWQRYDQYYPYGYNWEQRDNPCSKSYFNKERFAARNVIASNIGLTAKRGNNNQLFVAATNLLTTQAMGGVSLKVLDYQSQVIGQAKTGSDGTVAFEVSKKPYLLIAEADKERGYLKLDDGSALPLSRFDVSGSEVKNGLKGFVFGERGVWRPGDSLFLSAIIEDKQNKLPEDHPVEMELYSPAGQLYKKMVQTNAEDGYNVFRTATDADAPTGNWVCKIKVGGAVFEKKLKIETVMPNRLKIDLDFGSAIALGAGTNTPITLSSKWLFGAPAQNLKARVDASLYKTKTTFPKFEGYTFDNPTANYTTQARTIFDGQLSSGGTATINPNFNAGNEAPGMLTANLLVKVFEQGGNFSIDNLSIPYHPYNTYMGVKVPEGAKPWGYLATGKVHKVDVVNVNTSGALLQGSGSTVVELYKIQWRWWWDNNEEDLSNFTQDTYNKLIRKETVPLSNGRGTYHLNIPESDYGRYLVLARDGKSGHVTGQTFYVDDPYWQTRSNQDDPTAAAMLSFTANKDKYMTGDDIVLTIPSSQGGRALISIENGSGVLKSFWTDTKQGQTRYTFKAEKEMAPNVYATVTLLQPHAQTINDLPIRMYGAIPLLVEDKNTRLAPVITVPEIIRPEQQNTITVAEANGKDLSYVIAIVDDGLLDLTRYKTPDPHKAFYAKEALGVKSWDLFDYVIGAWGGDLERILTIGGDNEGDGPGKTKRANRFKPIVQFMGPFKSTGGKKNHTFTLPPYMGSVRAMVIAAHDGAYGFAEKNITVKKPVMLLATMPRVLAPAEQLRIPVTVFTTGNSIKTVNLGLKANPFIEAVGSTTKTVSFTGSGEQVVYFEARVKSVTGIGKVSLTATSGKESASHDIEIDIRNPNPAITVVTEKTLAAGQSFSTSVAAIGTAGTNSAVLEISSIPAINLQQRLGYLIQYPHGCIEQITSGAFPQLVLNQVIDLSPQQKLQADAHVRKAIEKIKNFQRPDGGFSYWPNDGPGDEWGTAYAGHFLLEAAEKGFIVPVDILQSWRGFMRSKANAWNQTGPVYYGGDLVQAYRLYVLALARAPELGAMNRLKEYKWLSPEGKWRLAAAYHLAGQQQVALKLISGLPTNFSARPLPGITFGSQLRDQAMALETLTIMNRKAEALPLLKAVAAQLATDRWLSTQTTAYALIAIGKYCGSNPNGSKIMAAGKVNNDALEVNSSSYLSQHTINVQKGKGAVQVTNKGNNVLYLRIINQGQPISGDSMATNNNNNLLAMSVNFITTSGAPLDPASITQGTDFVAKVVVKNTGQQGTYTQMALSNIMPSGWEILNTRLFNAEGTFKSSPANYMDIRDDRVYHYFNIAQGESLTYYVQLNAAYLGRFYWPGSYCQAMYKNEISAAVNGKWVEVVSSK